MRTLLIALAASSLLACHGRTDTGPGPGPTPVRPVQPAPSGPEGAVKPGSVKAGGACETNADCESTVCQGMGCGPRQGVCMDTSVACTRDLRPYCGCDGTTFRASSSCPGRRYAHRGECGTQKAADGAACRIGADCASGICEGKGCGDNNGRCAAQARVCTRDFASYCGCDGKTFNGSGSCPGRRYKARGACP